MTFCIFQKSGSVGTGAVFTGVRRPEPEASHLAQCSTEVKNERSYTYTSIWLYTVHSNKFTLLSLLDLRLGVGGTAFFLSTTMLYLFLIS